MKTQPRYRKEKDALGNINVPISMYYGSHTARAIHNFQISATITSKDLYYAIAIIKKACARANTTLKRLSKKQGKAIITACDELLSGSFDNQLLIDTFQAGSGTPINMNINEIIANRATEIIGGALGEYLIHPNDHVNMGQSTNNVVPTALRIVVQQKLVQLIKNSEKLEKELLKKSKLWMDVKKSGRTHLQDAVPITLGQEFSGYASLMKNNIKRVKSTSAQLIHVGLGGNAVGTSINNPKRFSSLAIGEVNKLVKFRLKIANAFAVTQSHTDFLAVSSSVVELATDINKMCNDLRLLSSGPTTGLNELLLPAVEPGSSIMPGKVNPSICECVNMICFQVFGNHEVITHACNAGQLELNTFTPVIAKNMIESITILTNGIEMLLTRCIKNIKPNTKTLQWYYEHSIGTATALNPIIGYDKAAIVANEAVKTKQTVKEVALRRKLVSKKTADKIFGTASSQK